MSDEFTEAQSVSLGDKTSVNIQLGFLVTFILGLVSVVAIFLSLHADVTNMLQRVNAQETIIEEQQRQITDFKVHIQAIDDKLDYMKLLLERKE